MAVVNVRSEHTYDVYVGRGRGSVWGNPYSIGKDGSREEVIMKYEKHLIDEILHGVKTQGDLASMYGKKLGCWCAPKSCHGDIIEVFANKARHMSKEGFFNWMRSVRLFL